MNGEARIEFLAAANLTYTVEYTENLDNPIWHKLTDVVAGPGRTVVLTDPAGASQRSYRLITPRQP